jgi:hypothetical protein
VINQTCVNSRWERTAGNQILNFFMLGLWAVILFLLAGWVAGWSMGRPLRRS